MKHGKNGYSQKCRCDICRAGHAEFMREYRKSSKNAKIKQAALAKIWYEKNKQLTIQRAIDWNKENIDRFKGNVLDYQRSEKGKETKRRYKSHKKNAKGSASKEQIKARWDLYGGKCYRCGIDAKMMDHVIPSSRGGTNWPSNLRPICNKCNAGKGNRTWP